MDQQWAKFKLAIKEAAEEELPRVEGKAKQLWMIDDILDLMGRRRQRKKKNSQEKYETLHKEIRKKN